MREVEIHLPADVSDHEIVSLIDRAISAADLKTALRGTLKKFPGSIHWHVKNGRESGTLEITYWPAERRVWFTIQDGRKAVWIEGKIGAIQEILSSP